MKEIAYYIWKNRLLPESAHFTTDGETISIINYGKGDEEKHLITDVELEIDGKPHTGEVVMCDNQGSPITMSDNVILHMAICTPNDHSWESCRKPLLRIEIPTELADEFYGAIQQTTNLQCHASIASISRIEQHSYMSRLLTERIEEKSTLIDSNLSKCQNRWNDALLKGVIRSFGFGLQSSSFNELADILDIRALEKHRDNLLQVEAIMFGQAGLLEEQSIPYYYREAATASQYCKELSAEFKFLKNKFGLQILDSSIWDRNHTPHVRIARLAKIFHDGHLDLSRIMECETPRDFYRHIDCTLDGYWNSHVCIGGVETSGNGNISKRHLDSIIINAIIPIIYLWGKKHGLERECSKAEDFLHQLNCEENRIVRQWKERGIQIECAADSQAILQLEKKYCRAHRCTACRFACFHIRQRLTTP